MCTAKPSIIAASDARRKRIEDARQEISDSWKAGRSQRAIEIGHEVLDLLEKEELAPMSSGMYANLVRMYLALGEREEAEMYGELALDVLRNHGHLGPDEDWDLERLLESFAR
jgi:hypothetical protein